MKKIYSFISHNLDYFATPLNIRFENHKNQSSIIGILLTIITGALAIAVTISSGKQLITREKPKVNSNDLFTLDVANVTMNGKNFPYSVMFENGELDLLDVLLDKSYVNLRIANFRVDRWIDEQGENQADFYRVDVPYEKCSNNYNKYADRYNQKDNFTQDLIDNQLDHQLCIKDEELVLGGSFTKNYFSNLMFEISPCNNSTDSDIICKPTEVVNDFFSDKNFIIYYRDVITDSSNFEKPFEYILNTYYVKLDTLIYKSIDVYFKNVTVMSDIGFMFEEKQYKSEIAFDFAREQLLIRTDFSSKFFRLYINISTNYKIIERYYMKAQELAALVGGIIKVAIVIFSVIANFFVSIQLDVRMVNHFFGVLDTTETDYNKYPNRNSTILNNKSIILTNNNNNKDKFKHRNSKFEMINEIEKPSSMNLPIVQHYGYLSANNKSQNNSHKKLETNKNNNTNTNNMNNSNINLIQNQNQNNNNNNNFKLALKDENNNINNSSILMSNNKKQTNVTTKEIDSKSKEIYNYFHKYESNQYKLSLFDSIFIKICPCITKKYKSEKKLYSVLVKKINEMTDFVEIIKQIISYKKLKKLILSDDQYKVHDFNHKIPIRDLKKIKNHENEKQITHINEFVKSYYELINDDNNSNMNDVMIKQVDSNIVDILN